MASLLDSLSFCVIFNLGDYETVLTRALKSPTPPPPTACHDASGVTICCMKMRRRNRQVWSISWHEGNVLSNLSWSYSLFSRISPRYL